MFINSKTYLAFRYTLRLAKITETIGMFLRLPPPPWLFRLRLFRWIYRMFYYSFTKFDKIKIHLSKPFFR